MSDPTPRRGALLVLSCGPAVTVQDLGRVGVARLGVARSGAFDQRSAGRANALVSNRSSAAVLEVVLGGLAVRALHPVRVALAGAPLAVLVNGVAAPFDAASTLSAGDVLTLGVPHVGVRTYLAVEGGVAAPLVLGSRSTDTLGGIGSEPVRVGDVIVAGDDVAHAAPAIIAPLDATGPGVVTVLPGPRVAWLRDGLAGLCRAEWTVEPASDRVGIRLDGPPLAMTSSLAMSEGMPPGSVQMRPDGRPVVLGPDGGVTGGYAVVGVVAEDDLWQLAQVRPGEPVRFAPLTGW